MSATVIDHGQQFTVSNDDLEYRLRHSDIGKVITNGSQISVGITTRGMFARHVDIVANAHSDAADIIHRAASDQKHGA